MKKVGLGLVALVAASSIYYLTIGSTQITQKMKTEINQELQNLQEMGLKVEKNATQEHKERYFITFAEPKKIQTYLASQGESLSLEEARTLVGMRFKLDLTYLPSTTDALAMDIYLDALPDTLEKSNSNPVLQTIKTMIHNGDIMSHITINKLLSHFDGYIKDIHQRFKNEEEAYLRLEGLTFNGDIQEEQIPKVQQELKIFNYEIKNILNITLANMHSDIQQSQEKMQIKYTIQEINASIQDAEKNSESIYLSLKKITGESTDIKHNGLLDNMGHIKIDTLYFKDPQQEEIRLHNIVLDSSTKNLDQEAFQQLQAYNQTDFLQQHSFKEMIPIIQKLTQQGLEIEISNLSTQDLTLQGEKIQGFNLSAKLKLDPNFPWKTIQNDPLQLTKLPNIHANINLSDELFNFVAQTPETMMLLLMAQPVDKNGTKVYDIEFSKGKLKLNGRPFM